MSEKLKENQNLDVGKMDQRLNLLNKITSVYKLKPWMKLEWVDWLKNIFDTFKSSLNYISWNDFAKWFWFEQKNWKYILNYKWNRFDFEFSQPQKMISLMILTDYVIKILQSSLSKTNSFKAYDSMSMFIQGDSNSVDLLEIFRKEPLSAPVMNYDFLTAVFNASEKQTWDTYPSRWAKQKLYSDTSIYKKFASFVVSARDSWWKLK